MKNVKLLSQSAKRNYFRNKFTEYNNSDKTWKTVKTLVPHNRHATSNCTSPIHTIEHFNKFFSKIGKLTYEQTIVSTLQ